MVQLLHAPRVHIRFNAFRRFLFIVSLVLLVISSSTDIVWWTLVNDKNGLHKTVQIIPEKLIHACGAIIPAEPLEICLEYLRNNQSDYIREAIMSEKCTKNNPHLFHGLLSRTTMHILRLYVISFLFTQRADCTVLRLWLYIPSDIDSENKLKDTMRIAEKHIGDLLRWFPDRLVLKTWNAQACMNSIICPAWLKDVYKQCMSRFTRHLMMPLTSTNPVLYSDVVRMSILFMEGGIYVDLDSIFLRDMLPLWHLEFAYRWGMYLEYNTAVLSLYKNSSVARHLLEQGARHDCKFHPMHIKDYLHNPISEKNLAMKQSYDLLLLPVALFDFLWKMDDDIIAALPDLSIFDGMWNANRNPNQTANIDYFFNRSFVYHYHSSRVLRKATNNSYVGKLKDFFERKLVALQPHKIMKHS